MNGVSPKGNRFERGEFRLEDPIQRALYDHLRNLVGLGPASFYKDACEHMAMEPPMLAITHQVGHLVREIDTALIRMLGPVLARTGQEENPLEDEDRQEAIEALFDVFGIPEGVRKAKRERIARDLTGESRADQIRSVLAALDIPEDETMRKGWISPSRGAHAWAHANQLLPPRPPDEEFYRFWEQTQAVWLAVLERFETRFTDSFPLIDRLLAVEQPTTEHVQEFQQGLPNTIVTCERFFGGMTDARWLDLLRSKHFFDHPPAPEVNEGGTAFVPPWPQSRLLARIAGSDPHKVRDTILAVPQTDNINVHADFAEAALVMPAELGAQVGAKAAEGLGSPYYAATLVRNLAALVARLAGIGSAEAAIELARQLLALVPQVEQDDVALLFTRDPSPRFRPSEVYEEVLETTTGPLVVAAGEEAFAMLCALLENAVRYSTGTDAEQGDSALPHEDALYVIRPAVEDSPLNHDAGPLGEVAIYRLLTAFREAAGMIAATDPSALPRLVEELEARENETFERLALHLLRTNPEAASAQVMTAERRKERIADLSPGLFHEYAVLLRENFERLSFEDRGEILNSIARGPSEDELRLMREYGASDDFHRGPLAGEELDAYVQGHADRWRLRRYAILADLLPEAERAEYERLAAEHPDISQDDPLFYGEPQVRAIPHHPSPRSAQDLRSMPVEEVVTFLRSFEPGDDWEGPGVRDVAHELHLAVAGAAARFAPHAEEFRDLDPSYVRAFLWGLRDGLQGEQGGEETGGGDEAPPTRHGSTLSWPPVLRLCRWILDQPRQASEEQYRGGQDIGWGLSRQWIAELLRWALWKDGELPFELRGEVWDALRRLSEDPEPTLAYEQERDRTHPPESVPRTLAINTVRGVAVHAVVDYALWVRRNLGKGTWQGLASVPEAREVLEELLDPAVEPTCTIRSVYGARLPQLLFLDRPWLEDQLPRIFPEDAGEAHLREAAWESYLLDWIPSGQDFEVLRAEYAHAVTALDPERIPGGPRDPEGYLARHLMILLWNGTIAFGDPDGILETFYARASDPLRARAAGFVGRQLRNLEDEVPAEQLARFEDLWERRLASAVDDPERPSDEELGALSWFFLSGKFHEAVALERLDRAMVLGADVGHDAYQLVGDLAAVAPRHPALAVACLDKIVRAILDRPDNILPIVAIETNALRVLFAARDSGDEDAGRTARDLASRLVVRGHQRFQSFLGL